MRKENVYIVLSHKHVKNPRAVKGAADEWEVSESVEFVNQLRNKHLTTSSAIGDYINRKMISGARFGMSEYSNFEDYIRSKYQQELSKIDDAYYSDRVVIDEVEPEFVDQFGNARQRTVFD